MKASLADGSLVIVYLMLLFYFRWKYKIMLGRSHHHPRFVPLHNDIARRYTLFIRQYKPHAPLYYPHSDNT
jgi:hypothetical protein